MTKPPHSSINGFVSRRPGATIGQSSRPLGGASRPSRHKRPTASTTVPTMHTGKRKLSDLDQSLAAIDDEPTVEHKKRWFRRRRRNKHTPPSKRKKILKRLRLLFIILLVVAVGYFGWKIIQTGANIFQGNLLGLFQQQRLKEDSRGRTNVLIFGTSGWNMDANNGWDGALLTDSIMVASFDQDAKEASKVYTMSLPRDLYVGTCNASGKLNEVYYCSNIAEGKSEQQAAADFRKKVGDVLGLNIQYYAHANWAALQKGVNAVGGVDIKIESSDSRGIYDVATGLNYKNGEVVHMDGEEALAFARARNSHGGYGLSGGNFDREKNQQKLLAALQKKATSAEVLANPASLSGLLDAIGDNLRTNFQTGEIRTLLDIAKREHNIQSLPFVGTDKDGNDINLMTTGNINGISIVQPTAGIDNFTDIRAYVAKNLYGDSAAIIDVLNGSDIDGLASRKADQLQANGYIIGNVDNAPAEINEPVRLYRLSDGKNDLVSALEKQYNISAQSGGLTGYVPSEGADFILVFSS